MLFVFAGCSGVGKDTIMKLVIGSNPAEFAKFPSYTTRKRRKDESEGNPYFFISEAEFLEKLKANEIFEYNYIHEQAYYGVSTEVLNRYLDSGKIIFKDVDVEGVRTYKKKLAGKTRCVSIYLYCSDEETVIARLRGRGDTEESIAKRRQRFAMEDSLSCESDYMINNIHKFLTAEIARRVVYGEKHQEIWLPAKMPTEQEIAAECARETLAPVTLGYNGSTFIITEGAAAYAAALRTGRFVQKKISENEINELLIPCCTAQEWQAVING